MGVIEITGKTVDEAITNALIELETTSDKIEYEVLEKGSSGILGIFNSKPAKIKAWKKVTIEDKVHEFLNAIFQAMKMEVNSDIQYDKEEGIMNINLSGAEMGVLIGLIPEAQGRYPSRGSQDTNFHTRDYSIPC